MQRVPRRERGRSNLLPEIIYQCMHTERNTRQIRVDREIHQQLKILCAKRRISICDLATKILEDFLNSAESHETKQSPN